MSPLNTRPSRAEASVLGGVAEQEDSRSEDGLIFNENRKQPTHLVRAMAWSHVYQTLDLFVFKMGFYLNSFSCCIAQSEFGQLAP